MTVTLGSVAQGLAVNLTLHADFVCAMRRSDGQDWPESVVSLEFQVRDGEPVTWNATLSGDTAQWNVDQDEVDALIEMRPRAVRLWYIQGELRLLWAQGEVEQRGI